LQPVNDFLKNAIQFQSRIDYFADVDEQRKLSGSPFKGIAGWRIEGFSSI
jgi:hypothetical protein